MTSYVRRYSSKRITGVLNKEARDTYQNAILYPEDTSLENLINRGYAYLRFGKNFHGKSLDCFKKALYLDTNKKYFKEIDTGLEQIETQKTEVFIISKIKTN